MAFVDVQITAGTVQPSRQAFGIPLCLSHEAVAVMGDGASSLVGDMSEVVALGFSATSATYALVEAIFRQSPRPPSAYIGAMGTTSLPNQKISVAFVAAPVLGDVTTLVLTDAAGVSDTLTYTSVLSDTAADVADAIRTAAAALTIDVTVAAGTGTPVIFDADNVGEVFGVTANTVRVEISDTTTGATVSAALDSLHSDLGGGFYGVVCDVQSSDVMDAAAAWALTNKRLFGGAADGTSAATAKAASNDRAYFLGGVSSGLDSYEYAAASWMGDMLSRDAGSATWAFKTLEGVPALAMSTSARTTLEAAGSNWYGLERGVGVTAPGKVASGEWIDVTRGLDWLVDDMEASVYTIKINNPKIPFTDAGIALVRAEVEGSLRRAEGRGLLDAGWVVTVPAAEAVPVADRAARTLTGVKFQARLAGAIHETVIRGTVSV